MKQKIALDQDKELSYLRKLLQKKFPDSPVTVSIIMNLVKLIGTAILGTLGITVLS